MEIQRMQLAQDGLHGRGGPARAKKAAPNIDEEYFVSTIELPEGNAHGGASLGRTRLASAGRDPAIHRWVFQPSGLCDPDTAALRFAEGQWQELTFEVLTGELGSQRFYAQ